MKNEKRQAEYDCGDDILFFAAHNRIFGKY